MKGRQFRGQMAKIKDEQEVEEGKPGLKLGTIG